MNNLTRRLRLGMAVSMFLSSTSAYANTTLVTTIRDWSLWETNTDTYSACFMESSDEENNTYIRISKTKNNPADPAELLVRMNQNPRGSTGVLANIKGAPQTAFADMDGSKTNFWGIPKSLASFSGQIHANKETLKLKGVGGKKDQEVKISSQGYKYILEEMEKRCNNGQSILTPEFEQNFLSIIPEGVDPTKLDTGKTSQLRNAYFTAHRSTVEIKKTQKELEALLAKYQGYLDELKTNSEQTQQIQTSTLPQARQDLTAAQQRQAELRAELSRIEGQIPALQAKVQQAQRVLADAQAVVAPLVPEHDRLESNLTSAQSILRDSQNRLNYIDSRLRDGAARLSSLRSEASSLESNLPQVRSQRDRAAWEYRDAQSRRSQFNPSWERDQRLRNNFEYSRLHNERSATESNLRSAEMDLQRTRAERDRVARDLNQCRIGFNGILKVASLSTDSDSVLSDKSVMGPREPRPPGMDPGNPPGGGGGLRPGPRPDPFEPRPEPPVRPRPPEPRPPRPEPPGGGLVPGPRPPVNPRPPEPRPPIDPQPPVPPRPDCSHLERALNVANSQVAQAESNVRQYRNRLSEIDSRMNSIINQIDWEVRREYDMLVSREDQARREYERLDRQVSNDESRLAQIRNSEIPNLESEQRQLQNERPSIVSRINEAQTQVDRYSRELANFEAANNWHQKMAVVNSAQAKLTEQQSSLDAVLAQRQQAQANLNASIGETNKAQARVSELLAQLETLAQRAKELNELTKNLPAERAPLDAKIANAQNVINAQKAQVTELLK